ncbi:MAG: MoxR family ATPase [Methanotrichaceae archaeon]|nr:MoxR family ATPase [Methanotrichaceae archaeon]MDD1758924.1 MoxR family ATPase [Methanotrichaceae archaeon]
MTENLKSVYNASPGIFQMLRAEIDKVMVGQKVAIEQILVAILAGGHALLESNPGLAKTLLIKTTAMTLGLSYSRIQCTPDLMPADITGTTIIEEIEGNKRFRFEPGPVFANIVLADEINRASPKTQSALLEAMQERQVTVGNKTYPLDKPFFILATQNPIEMEGTFPLPEAQLDRLLLKIFMEYPSFDEELEILERYTGSTEPTVERSISKEQILALQQLCRQIPVSDDLKKSAVNIVLTTRKWEGVQYGASPRASIGLILSAKARAFLNGRNYISKEDLHVMAYPVLRHRIILSFEAERKGLTRDLVVTDILKSLNI